MRDEFIRQLEESADLKMQVAREHADVLAAIAGRIVEAFKTGRRVWFCGNGGSFTDAHHIVGELVGRLGYDRPALPAFVLGAGVSAMTAIANDYGYDQVFSREAEGVVQPGDVLVGLSTSGNSRNVCDAMEVARRKGAVTVGLAGGRKARIDEVSDLVLHVPAFTSWRIQEVHITVGHVLCHLVERELFPRPEAKS